jgi:hypothetical protein
MSRWVQWRVDEFELLIDLYEREGREPSEASIANFRALLVRRAKPIEPRSTERQFRSESSIWQQLFRLVSLVEPTARSVWVPRNMQEAWDRHKERTQSREQLSGLVAKDPRTDSGRETIVEFLTLTERVISLRN